MSPQKRERVAVLQEDGKSTDAYIIPDRYEEKEIKEFTKFRGYNIEYQRFHQTNIYDCYIFRIRREK